MATIQVRVSDEDKKAAIKVLTSLGLDLTTAMRMYLKRIVVDNGIPFPARHQLTENGFTPEFEEEMLQASREARKGIGLSPAFENTKDAITWLHSSDSE